MFANKNIAILTHCDYRRVIRALLLAQSVPAEIEVICAVNGTNQDIRMRLGDRKVPDNLIFVDSERQYIYPANALRNIALESATREWVFYIDCDFIFCTNFWDVLRQRATELGNAADKVCYCPVALCDPRGEFLAQPDNPRQVEVESESDHRPPRDWEDCDGACLFKNHKMYFSMPFGSGFAPYEITDAMKRLRNIVPSEPWGLLKRKHAVFADEDFRSGPMDKQQAVSALLDCGVRFFAIPDIFIFHLWHPESLDNKYDRVRNECLWARRHRDTSRTYLLIGLGGILPHGLEGRLQNTMSRSDEQAVIKDSALAGTKASCEFGNSQNHNSPVVLGEVIVGPHAISRDLFARHLRLCVFFSSPAYYRETYNCSATARGNQAPSDYVRLFSESGNIHDAIASIENVSALFHLGDPNRCSRMFRNLTGVGVPVEWFEMEKCLATRARLRENQDRLLYPNEYLLYDFARACAGSFR